MGTAYGYICPKCHTKKALFYGNGMNSFTKEQLLDQNNKYGNVIARSKNSAIKNLDELISFLKKDNITVENNFKEDNYYCNKCKRIYTKFKYVLKSNNEEFIPVYTCISCNNELSKNNINNQCKVICDNCNIEMTNDSIINWD
jgi:hypothetical protein